MAQSLARAVQRKPLHIMSTFHLNWGNICFNYVWFNHTLTFDGCIFTAGSQTISYWDGKENPYLWNQKHISDAAVGIIWSESEHTIIPTFNAERSNNDQTFLTVFPLPNPALAGSQIPLWKSKQNPIWPDNVGRVGGEECDLKCPG